MTTTSESVKEIAGAQQTERALELEVGARKAERVLELDVLRGLSIFMVLVSHTAVFPQVHSFLYFPLTVLSIIGWSGVDVFFVLSGYLVGGLLMREYQRTGGLVPARFWVRRAFKVWPTFYFYLVTTVAVSVVVSLRHGASLAGAFAATSVYWPNWLHIQNYVNAHGYLEWLWSLAVEEHFYLLLPWVLTFILGTRPGAKPVTREMIARRMTLSFVGIATVCMALRGITFVRAQRAGVFDPFALIFPTHLRIDSLFCGVFLAYVARFHDERLQRLRPYRYLILGASLLAWVPFYFDPQGDKQLLFYPWGLALLYVAASGLVVVAHLASTRAPAPRGVVRRTIEVPMKWFAWLGVRSYAIYVWHGYFAKPIAHRVCDALHLAGDRPGLVGWTHDIIYLATYIVLGGIMYQLVELPGLRLRQRVAPPIIETAAP